MPGGIDRDEALQSVAPVFNLMALLGTNNIQTEKEYPPEKLNRSRKRKNKLAFFSYNILSVGSDRWVSPYVSEGFGTWKRSHLRSGHIRRLQNGGTAWVRQTFVKGCEHGGVEND